MKDQLSAVLQKEMTRKEFLATLGLGIASIMGISTILGLLSGKVFQQKQTVHNGYGSSAYGGAPSKG